jgi:hypothetical protein
VASSRPTEAGAHRRGLGRSFLTALGDRAAAENNETGLQH